MLIIVIILYIVSLNFPSGPVVKNLPAMQRSQEMQVLSGSGRFPGGGHPIPAFFPGESLGQRSLAGYSP